MIKSLLLQIVDLRVQSLQGRSRLTDVTIDLGKNPIATSNGLDASTTCRVRVPVTGGGNDTRGPSLPPASGLDLISTTGSANGLSEFVRRKCWVLSIRACGRPFAPWRGLGESRESCSIWFFNLLEPGSRSAQAGRCWGRGWTGVDGTKSCVLAYMTDVGDLVIGFGGDVGCRGPSVRRAFVTGPAASKALVFSRLSWFAFPPRLGFRIEVGVSGCREAK